MGHVHMDVESFHALLKLLNKKINNYVKVWDFMIENDLASTQEINGLFTAQSGLELFLMPLTVKKRCI